MKAFAIIFTPLLWQIGVIDGLPRRKSPNESRKIAPEEIYPFWTWFLPNPLWPPKKRK